jgi:hypothetical protein
MKRKRIGFVAFFDFLFLGTSTMCANPLRNPPFSVDSLILLEGAEALLRGATVVDATPAEPGKTVRLPQSSLRGSFVTAPRQTEFEFNEAIPSWNGRAAPGASFRICVRVRAASESWSPWLECGSWGAPPPREEQPITSFEGGHVEIDILFAEPPAREFQFRVDLFRATKEITSPEISLLAFSSSNTTENRELWETLDRGRQARSDFRPSVIDLPVPFRSQKWEAPSMAMSVCSPTCVAMVLEMFGVVVDTAQISRLVLDPDHGIYGNWSRNVQAAAHFGARGYVDRFRSWDHVRRALETGSPIIAAIRFDRGELEQPPCEYSSGHLLVVRGFTADGDIICNDPVLNTEKGGNGCVWKAKDLATAWFDRGGVGYVLTPP